MKEKKKEKVLSLLLILSLVVVIGLSIKNIRLNRKIFYQNNTITELIRETTQDKFRIENLLFWRNLERKVSNLTPPNSIDGIELFNISEIPRVVYYFNQESSCQSCVERMMENIIGYKSQFGEDRILILSNFRNDRECEIFRIKYGLTKSCITVESFLEYFNLKDTNINEMIFIIDKNGRIVLPYVLSNDEPFQDDYFDLVDSYMQK